MGNLFGGGSTKMPAAPPPPPPAPTEADPSVQAEKARSVDVARRRRNVGATTLAGGLLPGQGGDLASPMGSSTTLGGDRR